jgi:hypothetical protein
MGSNQLDPRHPASLPFVLAVYTASAPSTARLWPSVTPPASLLSLWSYRSTTQTHARDGHAVDAPLSAAAKCDTRRVLCPQQMNPTIRYSPEACPLLAICSLKRTWNHLNLELFLRSFKSISDRGVVPVVSGSAIRSATPLTQFIPPKILHAKNGAHEEFLFP